MLFFLSTGILFCYEKVVLLFFGFFFFWIFVTTLQELKDVEEILKREQEDAQASLNKRHSKSSGETVMLQKVESKKNKLVSFHFYLPWD